MLRAKLTIDRILALLGYVPADVAGKLDQFEPTTADELRSVISDETGTGALVFATSPVLVTPALGTPSSGNLANCTGYPIPANLPLTTSPLSQFAATTSAQIAGVISDETGSGRLCFATAPTFVGTVTFATGQIDTPGSSIFRVFASSGVQLQSNAGLVELRSAGSPCLVVYPTGYVTIENAGSNTTQPTLAIIPRGTQTAALLNLSCLAVTAGNALEVNATAGLRASISKAGGITGTSLTVSGATTLGPFTFATVPSASSNAGGTIRITDRSHRLATSDGTNWNWAGTTTAIS
jgi:hypothetical protein